MSLYEHKLDTFGLVSTWECKFFYSARDGLQWYITQVTTAQQTITFPVSLPFDAQIHRAWLSMGVSSPATGAAIRKINGQSLPSDGIVELDGINATTTEYQATYVFKANGAVIQQTGEHSSRLTITDPTIHIEYTALSQPDEPGEGESIANRGESTGLQLPRLLGEGFREVERLRPIKLKLGTKLDPLSTAEMTLPPDAPEVAPRSFVELFSPYGSEGIFRVKETDRSYGWNRGQRLYLEHALGTLADSIAIGTQSISAPVATVFATLLQSQNEPHWVLGDCEIPEDYELVYRYGYTNLLQSIMELTRQLPDGYAWETDTLRYPFVMHLRKMPDDDRCECRMSRNLTTARMTMDASNLCTRIFPFGSGEGSDRITLTNLIGTQYLDSPNAGAWGLVSRTFTKDSIFDALTLRDVAQRYLDKHDHPVVSVTMDAMDLSKATGESLDRFRLGWMCRLPMPAVGVYLRERIIGLTWNDVYGAPNAVQVQLSNRLRDAADEIAELMREATNSKLIGGSLDTVDETARASNITPGSPFVQRFSVTGYGSLLSVKISYSCKTSGGEEKDCHVSVDGNDVPDSEARVHSLDITRYLSADENGVPLVGEHTVRLQPATLNTVTSTVENTITINQIKKR